MNRGGVLRGGVCENFSRVPPLFGRVCDRDRQNWDMDPLL